MVGLSYKLRPSAKSFPGMHCQLSQVLVHFLACPQRRKRFGSNSDVVSLVYIQNRAYVSVETSIIAGRQDPSIRISEPDTPIRLYLHTETAFMHQPMVPPAEQNEIIDAGFTAIGPVPDVVGIDKLIACTARETAAPIPSFQGTPYGGWNSA